MTISSATTTTTIHSIGHGNRSIDELLATLGAHGVRRLVDVRAHPGSRRHPQFGQEALARSLAGAAIEYVWMPELGGRRKASPDSIHTGWREPGFRAFADYMDTPEFAAAIDTLVRAAAERPTAVQCAERLYWQCHRRLIADALSVRGLRVLHILDERTVRPHEVTPFLRVEAARLVYRALL